MQRYKVHGVPVLFIPGNAGSYKQASSIAAAAARYFYASPGNPRTDLWDNSMRNLDFFACQSQHIVTEIV